MADIGPYTARAALAQERVQAIIDKINDHGWHLPPGAQEGLALEAQRYLIATLLADGRIEQDEVQAKIYEYEAQQLEALYQQQCTQPQVSRPTSTISRRRVRHR